MQKPRNMQIISRNTREAELLYSCNKIAVQFWGFEVTSLVFVYTSSKIVYTCCHRPQDMV